MTRISEMYREVSARYRPETIQRRESRLVGAIYARCEALSTIDYLRGIQPRDRGTRWTYSES